MQIIICDDNIEEAAITEQILKKSILSETDEVSVTQPEALANAVNNGEAVYDIAILDIEYHKESFNGIDLGRLLNEKLPSCKIIYLTEYLDYASDAYESEHCYFVQKKNQSVTLKRAMDKARKLLRQEADNSVLKVVSDGREVYLPASEIRYITRDGRLIKIEADREIRTYETLNGVSERLPEGFARCHTGYIVNLGLVKSMDARQLHLTDGMKIPVGRRYKDSFMDAYLKYLAGRV